MNNNYVDMMKIVALLVCSFLLRWSLRCQAWGNTFMKQYS